MLQFKESKKLTTFSKTKKSQGNIVGFVPTMGALHKGHISLIKHAKNECDIVICSIFVNPTQFNNTNDFKSYPIDINEDLELLEKEGCDVVFIPSVTQIYPNEVKSFEFNLKGLDKFLEGEFRPGHFDGVATVVNKFFNIVSPNKSYFGQKDYQQYCIIKIMAKQLNKDVEVIVLPTKREVDGLAMSSRNRLLTNEQRQNAPLLFKAMQKAVKYSSDMSISELLSLLNEDIKNIEGLKLDYIAITDIDTLIPVSSWENRSSVQLFVAAFFGPVRLIDNIKLERNA